MRSAYPKVVHRVGGQAMVGHVIQAIEHAGISDVYVVVGHGREMVRAALTGYDVQFIVQEQQLGTGHALQQASEAVAGVATLLVLAGDIPLIQSHTLSGLLAHHDEIGAAATVLSTTLAHPTGYGRIVRQEDNNLQRIVEEKDANEIQKAISEINSGIYCFNTADVLPLLGALTTNNAQGEYYLTDVLEMLIQKGQKVGVLCSDASEDILGINDRQQLAQCEAIIRRRKNLSLMQAGVTILDPASVFIDNQVEIGQDTVVLPNTMIEGNTTIGSGCEIGPSVRITNARIGNHVMMEYSRIIDAVIGDQCVIGPFAYLRPGAALGEGVKVGDFVEIKKSTIGNRSKIPHLSYIGDAQVGSGVNIGAGTITCNYDGKNKYPTYLEDGVFIGSNTNLVAPVRIGKDSVTGAGSTITRDVPPQTLAVERAQQKNIKGWTKKSKDM